MENFIDYEIIVASEKEEILSYCTGNNNKKLLVLYESVEKDETLEVFLGKILKAVRYDIQEDILLVRLTPEQHFSLATLCQEKDITYCISFGIAPKRLGMYLEGVQAYQPFEFRERVFLFAHQLSVIESNVKWKGQLWKQLQAIFLKK